MCVFQGLTGASALMGRAGVCAVAQEKEMEGAGGEGRDVGGEVEDAPVIGVLHQLYTKSAFSNRDYLKCLAYREYLLAVLSKAFEISIHIFPFHGLDPLPFPCTTFGRAERNHIHHLALRHGENKDMAAYA